MKVIIRDIPNDETIHPDQALQHLNNLMENFRMKYGNPNVVYFEMAINAFQHYYSYELGGTGGCGECEYYLDTEFNFCPICGSSLTDNYRLDSKFNIDVD